MVGHCKIRPYKRGREGLARPLPDEYRVTSIAARAHSVMTMTKSRSIRVALTVAVTAAVAACGSSVPSPTAAPTATPKPTPVVTPAPTARRYAYKDMVVGFVQAGSASPWRVANASSFTDTATAEGIALKVHDSQGSYQDQIAAFAQFDKDPAVNVIVLDPVVGTGYDDALKAAAAAGKVVVVEDQTIDSAPSLYATFVGADRVAEGQKAATAMCDLLRNFAAAKHNVAEIAGAVGAEATIDRGQGFRRGMTACGITIPTGFSQNSDWGVPTSKGIMSLFLKKSRNIQGVFAHNDEEAIGAIQAIKAAGLKPGRDIMVVGIDATTDGFKALITGELGADIEYNPLLGPQVFDAALRALNGDALLPKWIKAQEGQYLSLQGAGALNSVLATRKY